MLYSSEDFKSSKEMHSDNDYIACGDIYVLSVIPTKIWDEEFSTDDYLSALVSASLKEDGDSDEEIIEEVDGIIEQVL